MLDGFKGAVASRFNVKKWIGYSHLKNSALFITDTCGDLVKKNKSEKQFFVHEKMSFEEMMQLYQFSDKDIKKSIRTFRLTAVAFTVFSLAPMAYGVFLFYDKLFLGGVVSLLAGFLCLAYAYRSRVGLYQYENRTLTVDPKLVLKKWFHIK